MLQLSLFDRLPIGLHADATITGTVKARPDATLSGAKLSALVKCRDGFWRRPVNAAFNNCETLAQIDGALAHACRLIEANVPLEAAPFDWRHFEAAAA